MGACRNTDKFATQANQFIKNSAKTGICVVITIRKYVFYLIWVDNSVYRT
jgi:hypothetical protein